MSQILQESILLTKIFTYLPKITFWSSISFQFHRIEVQSIPTLNGQQASSINKTPLKRAKGLWFRRLRLYHKQAQAHQNVSVRYMQNHCQKEELGK